MGRVRQDAFERLFEEHARPLLAFLTYRTGDPVLAEDLLADTFERALRGRRGFDPRRGSEKRWLYAIALNLLRDRSRRRATEAAAVEALAVTVPPSHSPIEGLEQRDSVIEALTVLTQEEREAVALRFGADLTVPEMARVVGIKLPAMEARLYRALGKLRDALT